MSHCRLADRLSTSPKRKNSSPPQFSSPSPPRKKQKLEFMEGENPDELATSIIPKYLPLSFKDENKREILSEEVIRLMIQTLDDLGLKKSAKTLQEESHVLFEDEYVINFRKYILEGKWDTVHEIIPKLNIQNEIYKSTVEFLIYEQQYLELLELRNFTEALSLLQSQLTPIATSLSAYYLQIETSTNYTTPLNPPSPTPTPSSPATPLSPLSPASSNSKSLSESKGFVNTLHHLSTYVNYSLIINSLYLFLSTSKRNLFVIIHHGGTNKNLSID